MKAYHVHVVDGEYATIVFAESAREAKKLAMGTECCEDAAYIDIRVRREPIADQLYDGVRREIDWYNFETRKFLMENLNWSCYEPSWECDGCSLKPYCNWWEEDEDDA